MTVVRRRFLTAVALVVSMVAGVILIVSGTVPAWASHLGDSGGSISRAGTWGNATEVPGTAALNKGGFARIGQVSCTSAGNCSAGGSYSDASSNEQAFVVSEKHGTWDKAMEVPGAGTLNKHGFAGITSVSCASAGNCSAGGYYAAVHGFPRSQPTQALVVSEKDGTWGKAIKVAAPGKLSADNEYAGIDSVSCASAGNCSAGGGSFFDPNGQPGGPAFVVSERDGTWGKAIEVPGIAALNKGGSSGIMSVSCASAGNCSAGGFYYGRGGYQVFVVSERHGNWGKAIEVPGSAALNKGAYTAANLTSISCASAGNCSAGGQYTDRSGHQQAFVVSEKDGTWAKAIEVPGAAALNKRGSAQISSVSCASAGNCSAGGLYAGRNRYQAFVVSQVKGTWRAAIEVAGALNKGGNAQISSVSCASAGNCSAGGFYTDAAGYSQAFAVSQDNGTWATAIEVPGSGALNTDPGGDQGGAVVASVSCAAAGICSAGGTYEDKAGLQVFVVSQG